MNAIARPSSIAIALDSCLYALNEPAAQNPRVREFHRYLDNLNFGQPHKQILSIYYGALLKHPSASANEVKQWVESWFIQQAQQWTQQHNLTVEILRSILAIGDSYLSSMLQPNPQAEVDALAITVAEPKGQIAKPSIDLNAVGDRVLDVINRAINKDGVRFEFTDPHEDGIRVYQFRIAQDLECKDSSGKMPPILPVERLENLAQTLKVQARLPGLPVIYHGEGHSIVQIPKREWKAPRLLEYLKNTHQVRSGARHEFVTIYPGMGIDGRPVNITVDKHVAIGGESGGGKSGLLMNICFQLMYRYSPAAVRLLIADFHERELTEFDDLPWVYGGKVARNPEMLTTLLQHVFAERERRKQRLGSKQFHQYNAMIHQRIQQGQSTEADYMPSLIVLIDEVRDTADVYPEDDRKGFVKSLERIAQAFRKDGIFLLLATQRPSKENGSAFSPHLAAQLSTRIALKTADQANSKIILGESYGMASELLGKGDAYIKSDDYSSPARFQSWFVTVEEIERSLKSAKGKQVGQYPEAFDWCVSGDDGIELFPVPNSDEMHFDNPELDPLAVAIYELIDQHGSLSQTNLIQLLKTQGHLTGKYDKCKSLIEPYAYIWRDTA